MSPYCWLAPDAPNAHLPVCAPFQIFYLPYRTPGVTR